MAKFIKKGAMLALSQDDHDVTVWCTIDGKEFELAGFQMSFVQRCDVKGEPQNEVRGGRMLLTLTQILPQNLYSWAMKSVMKNGHIEFRRKSSQSIFRVVFNNAYCVNLNREIDSIGGGTKTELTVSPEEIEVNGTSFDNRWAS